VKEGTFGRGAPCGNSSARTQLFAAERQTSYGSKKEETLRCPTEAPEETEKKQLLPNGLMEDRELKAPTVANRALGLMLILGAAVYEGQLRPHRNWKLNGITSRRGVMPHNVQQPAPAAVNQPARFQFAGHGWQLTVTFTHKLATRKR